MNYLSHYMTERNDMSNFSKERLYELYSEYLPTFTRLARASSEEGVEFVVTVYPDGTIELESKDWTENQSGKRVLKKHFIRQGKGEVSDGSTTYTYDD